MESDTNSVLTTNLMATVYYTETVPIAWTWTDPDPDSSLLLYPFWDGYLCPDQDLSPCLAM